MGRAASWMSPANARWTFFCCLFVLALVHLSYLSALQSAQPIKGAAVSISQIARNLKERGRARQTDGAEDSSVSAALSSFKHISGTPTAQFVCRDVKPPQGDCTDALSRGLCAGPTLTHCLKTCGMCDVVANMIGEAAGVKTLQASRLTCRDEGNGCAQFVDRERCETHQAAALLNCRASCRFCQQHADAQDECSDLIDICPLLATSSKMCGAGPEAAWMQTVCQLSCGACVVGGGGAQQAWRVVELSNLRKLAAGTECIDYHRGCHAWAVDGRCSTNPSWMEQHCRRACSMCTDSPTTNAGLSKGLWKVGVNTTGHWRLSLAEAVRADKLQDPVTNPAVAAALNGAAAAATTPAAGAQGNDTCIDLNVSALMQALCPNWAKSGECSKNPGYMNSNCPKEPWNTRMLRAPLAPLLGVQACGVCKLPGKPDTPPPSFTWYPAVLESVMLNNGLLMPSVGFGTAGLGESTANAVEQALRAGFRHIDTAEARDWYREDLVGEALGRYPLPRESLFITSKVHPRDLGYELTMRAFDRMLADLKLEYLDLVLLHYPSCWGDLCKPLPGAAAPPPVADPQAPRTFLESWKALQDLYRRNKTRAIGVSNFGVQDLEKLYAAAQIKPQVLQVHVDPFAQSKELQAYCGQHGIQMVAYSSLGTQWRQPVNPVLNHPVLQNLALDKRRTVAQVVLRWVLQMGVLVIPRSSNPQHMGELLRLHEFNLTDGEVAAITMLDGTLYQP